MKIRPILLLIFILNAGTVTFLGATRCGAEPSQIESGDITGNGNQASKDGNQAPGSATPIEKSSLLDYYDYPESARTPAQKERFNHLLDLVDDFYEAKKYARAVPFLKEALDLSRDDLERRHILNTLMRCYSDLGRLEDLQQARREYLSRFPTADDAEELRKMLPYYEVDFAETRKFESNKEVGLSNDERPWLSSSKLPRMPIKWCILSNLTDAGKDKLSANRKKVFYRLAIRAADEWAKATNGKLKFLLVPDRDKADITCELTANLKERAHSWAAGEQHWNSDEDQTKIRALVFLEPKGELTEGDVFHTCLHELGHALGLNHSSHPEDTMYHSSNFDSDSVGWPSLSKNDVRRIRAIYADPFEGQGIAEQFVRAAYLNKDYESAYKLLRKEQRSQSTLAQFKKRMESIGTFGLLDKITVDQFGRYPACMKYRLSAYAYQRRHYFLVSVVKDTDGTFKIDNVSR